jgi:hypothetical protein
VTHEFRDTFSKQNIHGLSEVVFIIKRNMQTKNRMSEIVETTAKDSITLVPSMSGSGLIFEQSHLRL